MGAAVRAGASDIHIEPHEGKCVVRFRVDGILKSWKQFSPDQMSALVSRVKILAGMDIAEKRMPQDGRFTLSIAKSGRRDFRVSTAPMLCGEKMVVRILHQSLDSLSFEYQGYSEHNLGMYKSLLGKPHGLLLHCGPTGSGKTTSLYTAINYLNTKDRNIQTIEDPVEGQLKGINQAQVNHEIGLSFAALLRSYLRQDCDVILVGEIRDGETANLAIQASLTGHMILGTIHTNSAVGCVSRLAEMEVSPFFVGAALSGAVSQRLVRRLCTHCREPYDPPVAIGRRYKLQAGAKLYRPKGCGRCNNTGYKGRLCVQEVLEIHEEIRDAIHKSMPDHELQRTAERAGMINMLDDGMSKATQGDTSVEEVTRVVAGTGMSAVEFLEFEEEKTRRTMELEAANGPHYLGAPASRSGYGPDDTDMGLDLEDSVPGLAPSRTTPPVRERKAKRTAESRPRNSRGRTAERTAERPSSESRKAGKRERGRPATTGARTAERRPSKRAASGEGSYIVTELIEPGDAVPAKPKKKRRRPTNPPEPARSKRPSSEQPRRQRAKKAASGDSDASFSGFPMPDK